MEDQRDRWASMIWLIAKVIFFESLACLVLAGVGGLIAYYVCGATAGRSLEVGISVFWIALVCDTLWKGYRASRRKKREDGA